MSKPSGKASGLEHGISKTKDPQNDEYELLDRDNGCCWVETGGSTKKHSIETMERECITVQTNIRVSTDRYRSESKDNITL